MKILLIGFSKIKYMPYANFYLENIDCKNNEVHLLYWNRDLKDEDTSAYGDLVLHEFNCYQEDDVSKLSKVSSFLKYRRYAKKLLRTQKFDLIIALHSMPGVLLSRFLAKQYRNRYIFDYRDSTYERFGFYRSIIARIVKGSKCTFVSSDGFRCFLPESEKEKIYTSHNLLVDSLEHRDERTKFGIKSDKIRISFWGFIRHEDVNRELIKKIAADGRFELHYYGREQQVALNLKQYASDIGATNVFFHGEYTPEERYKFVRCTDVIHNLYRDANTMLAMGNKYYDGVIFRIPQICTEGAFMATVAEQGGVGIGVDLSNEDFCEKLYDYYSGLNKTSFEAKCDKELERIINDYRKGAAIIKNATSEQ